MVDVDGRMGIFFTGPRNRSLLKSSNMPMLSCRLAACGLALALLLPLRLPATTVEAPEFKELVDLSDYVVRGVVTAISPEWRETADGRRYIATRVEVNVLDSIRGTPPAKLVLDVLGGRVGEDELVVEGAPRFLVGDENVFFVRGNGRIFFPLVGVMHGLYPILHDFKDGQDYVLKSNGMPLYSAEDVSLPMDRLSSANASDPAARPLTADAFIRQVRQASPARPTPPAVEK
jgi:hypothetical protein